MQRVRKMVAGELPAGTDGRGVTVAVLDTGMGSHPDLRGRAVCFRDFVGHGEWIYDDSGHGTHVCGILCGNGRLSGGRYRGMAPGIRLVVGKILDERGDGSTEAMLEGLDWVLGLSREYDIRIVNISVGIGNLREPAKEQLLQDRMEELWRSGILVVCAAGNKGPREGSISAVGGNRVVTVGCYDGSFAAGNPRSCELYSGRAFQGVPSASRISWPPARISSPVACMPREGAADTPTCQRAAPPWPRPWWPGRQRWLFRSIPA